MSFQIKDIVAKSAYDMYETQLLQTTLESMADVDFCPRLNCQCATIVDREMNMGQVVLLLTTLYYKMSPPFLFQK